MELRKLENIGPLDRHRVEDVSKYTDAEVEVMLKGIFGLTDAPGKIKSLKAKEIYLLADGVAKKPLSNLPVLPPPPVAPAAAPKGGSATGAVEAKKGLIVPISVYRKGQDLIANYPPDRPPIAKAEEPKMEEVKPKCFKPGPDLQENWKDNPDGLEKEFGGQLKGQEDGLNDMTVGEYLDNRKKFEAVGRGDGSAQQLTREKARTKLNEINKEDLIRQGVPPREAKLQAVAQTDKAMDSMAALHEPDLVAGGYDNPTKMGDKGVNSSLGAQWGWKDKARVKTIDEKAEDALAESGPDTKMNVKLERCPPGQ